MNNYWTDIAGQELAHRELQVLALAAQGFNNDQIGATLFLSFHTVKTYLARAYSKLCAHDRAHAVAIAFREELIAWTVGLDGKPTVKPVTRAHLVNRIRTLEASA